MVSVIAFTLMVMRFREQWVLWIIVNVVSITMWIMSGGFLMALMWFAYLVNSIYGYWNWSKETPPENA